MSTLRTRSALRRSPRHPRGLRPDTQAARSGLLQQIALRHRLQVQLLVTDLIEEDHDLPLLVTHYLTVAQALVGNPAAHRERLFAPVGDAPACPAAVALAAGRLVLLAKVGEQPFPAAAVAGSVGAHHPTRPRSAPRPPRRGTAGPRPAAAAFPGGRAVPARGTGTRVPPPGPPAVPPPAAPASGSS